MQLIKVDPASGTIAGNISLPVDMPTCPSFGGNDDYSTMFLSTASMGMTDDELAAKPDSGALFEITDSGSTGMPHHRAVLDPALVRAFYDQLDNTESEIFDLQ